MTRNEFAANLHLTTAAQRAHVGAHFAKRGLANRRAPADIDWGRVSAAVMAAAPMLAAIIIRFA